MLYLDDAEPKHLNVDIHKSCKPAASSCSYIAMLGERRSRKKPSAKRQRPLSRIFGTSVYRTRTWGIEYDS
jgi:hypothetical protein